MRRNSPLKSLLISFMTLAFLLFGMVAPVAAQHPPAPSCGLPWCKIFAPSAAQRSAAASVTLPGHIPAVLAHAQLVGHAPANQRLALSIGLRLRDRIGLDALLRTMYDPRSPGYHHFLTPAQFNYFFAPTSRQVAMVEQYLRSQGIQVERVSPNHLLIDASATVAQVEQAFSVQINNYRLGARTVYAPASDPSVPANIAAIVQSIGGLDNVARYHPIGLTVMARARPNQPFPGPAGGYTPSELRTAYDENPLLNAGYQGGNQTIAIFELDGAKASDVSTYLNYYGISGGSFTKVLVDGFSGQPGAGAIEVELDIEVAAAMAPHAAQIIYEGPNTTQGVNDTYNKIVTDNKAQVMSTSWGECEQASGNAELQTLDNIFAQGASQGISFFAAAGDSGAYDCGNGQLSVDSPADDPNVSGVGGTHLNTGSGGSYQSESVWSDPTQGSGGGGGLSTYFSQPSWQTGPGVQNQYSNGMREMPDLSADADPNSGYSIYCTVAAAGCPSSGWMVVGGTSAAAPLWTAATAIMNQYLTGNGKSRIGFANPTWYQIASNTQTYTPYHDITTGNNLYYPATAGYDLASGWGSPDIYNLARDLVGGSGGGGGQGVMTLTPTSMSFSATAGGPNPASQTGTLGNTGTASYSFTASTSTQSGGNWLSVSPTSGSVPVNGQVSLTVSVNISGLSAGTYNGTVTVTSTNAQGSPQTIAVTLSVSGGGQQQQLIVNGGFENGQSPWQEYSSGGYQIIDPTNPHTGNYSAYLCGYDNCTDEIWQVVTLPSTFSQATLTYWFYSDTTEIGSTCYDYFYAQLRTGSGSLIKTVQTSCNANATNAWVEETFNVYSYLSSYKGKSIQVFFKGTTDYSNPTDFFVDDVSLTVQ
jgi:subtilase family serine protease